MQTESLERTLRAALHETLDPAQGPHAAWVDAPASIQIGWLHRRRRWPLRALAVAAVIGNVGGAALLAGALNQPVPTPETSPNATRSGEGIFAGVGGWIAYGGDSFSAIWAIDPARPNDRNSQLKLSSQAGTPRAWSPDGSKLLVVREVVGAGGAYELDLFLIRSDGTETRIAQVGLRSGAAFTPDGSRVIYGDGSSIYIVDAEGGTPELVLADDPPSWTLSPDGTQIAYLDWGRGDSEHSLRVMNRDGTGMRIVTEDPAVMGAGHIRGPSIDWSPDGQRLVFSIESHVWVVGIDGSGLLELTSGPTEVESKGTDPHWSPDGAFISYTFDETLVIVRPDGAPVQTSIFGRSGPWNPAGTSLVHAALTEAAPSDVPVPPTPTPAPTADPAVADLHIN